MKKIINIPSLGIKKSNNMNNNKISTFKSLDGKTWTNPDDAKRINFQIFNKKK
jgi:hypothetical protein